MRSWKHRSVRVIRLMVCYRGVIWYGWGIAIVMIEIFECNMENKMNKFTSNHEISGVGCMTKKYRTYRCVDRKLDEIFDNDKESDGSVEVLEGKYGCVDGLEFMNL